MSLVGTMCKSLADSLRDVKDDGLRDAQFITRRIVLLHKHFGDGHQPEEIHIKAINTALQAVRSISETSPTKEAKTEVLKARMEMERCIQNTPGLPPCPKELPDFKKRTVSLAAIVDVVSKSVEAQSQVPAKSQPESTAESKKSLEVLVKRCRENLLQPEPLSYRLEGGEYTFLDLLYVVSTLNAPTKKGNYVHVYAEDISNPWRGSISDFPVDYQKSNSLISKFKQPNKPLETYLVGNTGTFIIVVTEDGEPHLVSGKPKTRSKVPSIDFSGPRPSLHGTRDDLKWESLEKNGPLRPYQVYSLIPPLNSPSSAISKPKSIFSIRGPRSPIIASPTVTTPQSAFSMHSSMFPDIASPTATTPDTDFRAHTPPSPAKVSSSTPIRALDAKSPSPPPPNMEPPATPLETSDVPLPSETMPLFYHNPRVQWYAMCLFICLFGRWLGGGIGMALACGICTVVTMRNA